MRPIKRDDYVIRSGEIRHIAKPRVSMAALQWAADRAGLSYGKFTQSLTPEDEVRIQLDYDEWKRQKQHEAAARKLERRPEEPPTEGFIITDDDA